MSEHDRSGGRVLLFDKLTDDSPSIKEESPILQNYSREGFLLSVQQEVEALLNYRCKANAEEYKNLTNTPYGFPDLFGLLDQAMRSKGTDYQLRSVCSMIKKAIVRFEPRFSSVQVSAKKEYPDFGYVVEISGTVMIGEEEESLRFPLNVSSSVVKVALEEGSLYNKRKPGLIWQQGKEGNGIDKV